MEDLGSVSYYGIDRKDISNASCVWRCTIAPSGVGCIARAFNISLEFCSHDDTLLEVSQWARNPIPQVELVHHHYPLVQTAPHGGSSATWCLHTAKVQPRATWGFDTLVRWQQEASCIAMREDTEMDNGR